MAAGATEAGLQATESALGGEFDRSDIGLAAGFQPVAQAAGPLIAGARRFAGARPTQEVKEIIDEGAERGVDVLTTDL